MNVLGSTREPRVLIISLQENTDAMGIKYIHASLRANNFDSTILFCTLTNDHIFRQIVDFIKKQKYNIVGIGFMSHLFKRAINLTLDIKKYIGDNVTIVWGGTHPTIDPHSCRGWGGNPDYICVGEAEVSFVKWLCQWRNNLDLDNVPGINRSDSANFTSCEYVRDLDRLHFPEHFPESNYVTHNQGIFKLNKHLFKKYTRYNGTCLPIMSSRGCPYNCTYCCNHLLKRISGSGMRFRNPEHVVSEIRYNLRRSPVNINYVYFYDDCFIMQSNNWMLKFIELYRSIGIPIIFQGIPEYVTPEKVQILKDAPIGFACFGLQTGSERVHKEIYKRRFSRDTLLKSAYEFNKHNIPISYGIIVDNPYETIEDWEKTIDLVSCLPKLLRIQLYSLVFYRNSQLYKKAKADGIDVDMHIDKEMSKFNMKSIENHLIRLAPFWPKSILLKLLHMNSEFKWIILRFLVVITNYILEPLRLLKLAYFSQGKSISRLIRLLSSSPFEYWKITTSASKLFNKLKATDINKGS